MNNLKKIALTITVASLTAPALAIANESIATASVKPPVIVMAGRNDRQNADKREVKRAMYQSLKQNDCKYIPAKVNPGVFNKQQIMFLIQEISQGAQPKVTLKSTRFTARWKIKNKSGSSELVRVCVSFDGRGHTPMGLYAKPFKYLSNFNVTPTVTTALYVN